MNEQELRSLVREAIERHLGRPSGDQTLQVHGAPDVRSADLQASFPRPSHQHASHILLTVDPGSEGEDGQCVIEPAVRCNHCGFCQSYGH